MSGETILIADDDGAIRTVLSQALFRHGYAVRAEPTAAGVWQRVAAGEGDLVISDVLLPDESGFDLIARIKRARPELPIVAMSAQNTILTAIGAAERGAFDYLPKPFDLKHMIALVQRALAKPKPMRPGPSAGEERLPLIGGSPAMQVIYRSIARLTQTDLTVMIVGESGTGKELVARALHDFGKRRNGPFVAINMAALPKELVESELFGHERGASAGVTGRGIGCFEQAKGGTLFLDEIGDMPMEAQTRLLRVLQEGEYSSVGRRAPQKANVRIVAASNRDPRRLVHQGLLRQDLFYRLSVVPLRLPPLRERREDIADLARHFLRKAEEESLPAKNFEPAALQRLSRYRWPGNVRELENLVRRLVALEAGEMISAEAVSAELREQDAEDSDMADSLRSAVEKHLGRYLAGFGAELPPPGLYGRVLEEIERPLIALCLAATSGNQIRAAQLLGLNRNTLRKKMRELDLHGRA